jgi:threonine/homoserine/homoserine lactone efflux protein
MILHFFEGAALSLSAALMPGPFQALLLAQALKNGWRTSLPMAVAPLITDGPIIVLVLVVLTRMPPWLVDGLRVAGGLLMMYLSGQVFRGLRGADMPRKPDRDAARKGLLSAVFLNAMNPNPYLFWGVIGGPIVLAGWRESGGLAVAFLAGFYGTFIVALAVLIVAFATAGRLNPKITRTLMACSALALALFGLYQCYLGLRALFP